MRVKKYRLDFGMTQAELAEYSGVSVRQIRDIESGKVSPLHVKADTIIRLATVFRTTVEDLMHVVFDEDSGKLAYAPED